MSIPTTETTPYHEGEQSVRSKPHYVRLDGLNEPGFPNLSIGVGFAKKVDGTQKEYQTFDAPKYGRQKLVESTTAAERTILKKAVAIFARIAASGVQNWEGIAYDETDELT